MKNFFFLAIVLLITLALLLAPELVFAQAGPFSDPDALVQCGEFFTSSGALSGAACTWCHIFALIRDIINWLVGVLTVIVTLMIVYGGVRYLISFGNPTQLGIAKEIIMSAVWGLIIGLLSYFIIGTVIQVLAGFTTPGQTAQYPKNIGQGFDWPWDQIDCQNIPGAEPTVGTGQPQPSPTPSPAVSTDIKANGQDGPVQIDSGTTAELSWFSQNADECSVTPCLTSSSNLCYLPLGRFTTDPITENTTFTLICSGISGSAEDKVIVNVGPVQPPPPPVLNLTVNGSTNPPPVTAGTPEAIVFVSWTSSDTKSCNVTQSGSSIIWVGTSGDNTITLGQTTTFTLTCEGLDGSRPTLSVTQVVQEAPLCTDCKNGNVNNACQQLADLHFPSTPASYPRKNHSELDNLIACIPGRVGVSLAAISPYFTYDQSYDYCNYNRNHQDHICGPCSHSEFSCHYGGQFKTGGALAVDFCGAQGDGCEARYGDLIIAAALNCGSKGQGGTAGAPRCEDNNGNTVACSSPSATHVHVNALGCDRN